MRLPTGDEWEARGPRRRRRAVPVGRDVRPRRAAPAPRPAGLDRPGRRAHPPAPGRSAPSSWRATCGSGWPTAAPTAGAPSRGGSYLDTGWGLRAARVQPADPARPTTPRAFASSCPRRVNDARCLIDALREVYDPCCADRGISIVDMGVVEDVRVDGSHVDVDLVLTTGWCPFVASMSTAIPEALTRARRRRDRRREGRLGSRSGRWTACPSRPARSSRCRWRSWSPTAREGALPDGDHRDAPTPPRAQGRRVRVRLRVPHLQLRQGERARPARRAVRRAPLRLPPAAHARGRDGPLARRVLQGVERRRDLRHGHRGLRHRHDRRPAAAAHRPLPRRPVGVGEVRRDGGEAPGPGRVLGLGQSARGQEGARPDDPPGRGSRRQGVQVLQRPLRLRTAVPVAHGRPARSRSRCSSTRRSSAST